LDEINLSQSEWSIGRGHTAWYWLSLEVCCPQHNLYASYLLSHRRDCCQRCLVPF